MSNKAKGLTPEQQDVLRDARAHIRESYYDRYNDEKFAGEAIELCDKLSALIGERYSFRTGDVIEPKVRRS